MGQIEKLLYSVLNGRQDKNIKFKDLQHLLSHLEFRERIRGDHFIYTKEEANTLGKSVEYYLSKGFDKKMAEYFAAGRRTITGVVPNDDFTLTLSFDNGEQRLYNAAPLLQPGTVFEPFADLNNFRRVYLDDTHCIAWDIDPNIDSNIVWNNKVDLCPDSCYVDSVPLS